MNNWKSVHECRFCQSTKVFPILYPRGGDCGPGEKAWECQSCDMAWDADVDQSEAVWDAERKRFLDHTGKTQRTLRGPIEIVRCVCGGIAIPTNPGPVHTQVRCIKCGRCGPESSDAGSSIEMWAMDMASVKGAGRVSQWCREFDEVPCPEGKDTYDEGVRASKGQVHRLLKGGEG